MKLDPDGRLRTIYSPAGTVTGRLNSTQTPWGTGWNSQNAPPWFRVAIIPDEGYVLGSVDLKQAEAVLVAYFAKEPDMIRCFQNKEDIHRFNASNIYGISADQVSKAQRYIAKRLVHAFDYLLGDDHAASIAETSIAEARRVKKAYFGRFPRILEWHEEVRNEIQETRTLVNPFGRRRLFLDRLGDELVRKAVAFLPQSTCVDTTNEALLRMDKEIASKGLDVQLLLQVHDEIVFEFRQEQQGKIVEVLKECYDIPIEINGMECRIGIEFKVGWNWGEMGEVKI
uniref:Putative DNA polymerase n=1 Tax=viral metagenome TaxID=1070528 RepID=A0A6M3IGT3_9ZZZZ